MFILQNRTNGGSGIWSTKLLANESIVVVIITIREKKRKPFGDVKLSDMV